MKLIIIGAVVAAAAFLGYRLRTGRSNGSTAELKAFLDESQAEVQPSDADALLAGFSLVDNDTEFLGPWKETRMDGVRVAFQTPADHVVIYAGEFDADEEQISEVYLGRVPDGRALPPAGSDQRLDRFVGAQGRRLAELYVLYASGPTEYPQLQIPAVRDGLVRLSDAATEFSIFESGGVSIELDRKSVDRERVAEYARIAASMAVALETNLVGPR